MLNDPVSRFDPDGRAVPVCIAVGAGISIAEGVAATFGLTLIACMAVPECRAAVEAALQDAARQCVERTKDITVRITESARRCWCKHRHPTWMACGRGTPDPESATMIAAYRDARESTAHLKHCNPGGKATNCPGGAPGERYYCAVWFWDKFNKVTSRVYSVNCCRCCWRFSEGTSCKALHMSGGPGGQPPPP